MRGSTTACALVFVVACSGGDHRPVADAATSSPLDPAPTQDENTEASDEASTTESSEGGETGSSTGHADATCPGGDSVWNSLLQDLEADLFAQGGVGLAIAVVCDGELVHAAGIGRTQATTGTPVTPQTRFQLASVTKMFTGATAVALAEKRVVGLSDPVGDVLGPSAYSHATLHELLTHTAGYPTEFARVQSDELLAVVADNADQALWAPPGAVWNYSNPGFAVAGAVLERATDVSFGELVEREIFRPARMDRATMSVAMVLDEGDYAFGHEGSAAAPIAIAPDGAYFESGSYGPMGGAWGSVEDLALWGTVHLQGGAGVMSAEGVASLSKFHTRTADPELGYGYGLFIESYYDPPVVSHGGSTPGYLAHWRLVPELGFGVFVLANADWVSPARIADDAMDRYVGLGYSGGPGPDPTPDAYLGTYVDPYAELGTVVITHNGGQLWARINGGMWPMTHIWADSYLVEHPGIGGEIEVAFWRAGGANASYLVSIWGIGSRV